MVNNRYIDNNLVNNKHALKQVYNLNCLGNYLHENLFGSGILCSVLFWVTEHLNHLNGKHFWSTSLRKVITYYYKGLH